MVLWQFSLVIAGMWMAMICGDKVISRPTCTVQDAVLHLVGILLAVSVWMYIVLEVL